MPSVLGEKGTSTSQGEKICLSLCKKILGPNLVLLQQCTLTASTESTLHCPEGKLRPRSLACRATKLKPLLFREAWLCGQSYSFQLPTRPSVHPWEGHAYLGCKQCRCPWAPQAVNMMSCGSTHSPLCARVPEWASQVLRGRHQLWPTAKGTGVRR